MNKLLKSTRFVLVFLLFHVVYMLSSCNVNADDPITKSTQFQFNTIGQFNSYLDDIGDITDDAERKLISDSLIQYLKENKRVPFTIEDSVVLLYYGSANKVEWAGDFTGWSSAFTGEKVGASDIWRCNKRFPSDSRLDYKVIINGNNWIFDPLNSYRQNSGFGDNSELRMPNYVAPLATVYREDITRGTLELKKIISSTNLGYDVAFRVYLPYGYQQLNNLPVVYVTDGQEYEPSDMGCMVTVLDNMISDGLIAPVIAVFVDPRNVVTSENRRLLEYNCNPNFAAFLAQELVSEIDNNYKTNASAEARVILGTSMGGLNSAYVGSKYPNIFKLLAIQSPAFWYNESVYAPYENGEKFDLNIFMTTGTIHDTQEGALRLKSALDFKGYTYKYIEVNEGHSWGNWKALIDDMLLYYFKE